jgi:hypothetical protein
MGLMYVTLLESIKNKDLNVHLFFRQEWYVIYAYKIIHTNNDIYKTQLMCICYDTILLM